jgi:hypothetical protein
VTDAITAKSVVKKFREKYGAKDVRKCYSKFDVAVVELVHSTFRAREMLQWSFGSISLHNTSR